MKTLNLISLENSGVNWLQTIYEDGKFYNQTTLEEIKERLNKQ